MLSPPRQITRPNRPWWELPERTNALSDNTLAANKAIRVHKQRELMETTLQPKIWTQTLADRIQSHSAHVGIVGLGYVGLPLAVEFAKAGFTVTGIDLLESKVARVNLGDSYIQDIPSSELS